MPKQPLQVPNVTKEILSTTEVAAMMGVAVQTYYNWTARGIPTPPAIKIPGIRGSRFIKREVLRWLSSMHERPALGRPRKEVDDIA